MHGDLPSTAALRAFATAARTGSFKQAAAELHLSPSALSRQIQSLEAQLGVSLFRRLNPGLELTARGRVYLAHVERALATLREAQDKLASDPSRPLRVSSLESFSARWLVPRLADFERAHPEITLEIEASLEYADFERDPIDVAIRFGTGPWEGLHGEPLVETDCFPVCSPGLAAGDPPLSRVEDLAAHCLIHVSQVPLAWKEWLAVAGAPDLEPTREVLYDHVGIALSAAEAGQGVALGTRLLCGSELETGRLVVPIDVVLRAEETYHLVCPEAGLSDPRVVAFRDWLVGSLAPAD